MRSQHNWPVAIIGSGNLGTDLLIKILRSDGPLSVAAMAGNGPDSDGLARAGRVGVPTTARGVDGLLAMPNFGDIKLVFDASEAIEAGAHRANCAKLANTGVRMLGLTPAAIGPYCVPAVNLDDHLEAPNLNMLTCAGQATVPIVAAVAETAIVSYAEIVSSISSRSVGPGARASIDDFIETTATALQVVGGAQRGKAVMIINPADPPICMRNTVYCLVEGEPDHSAIEESTNAMVEKVCSYVPGYRLKRPVQFETVRAANPLYISETGKFIGTRVTVFLEVVGAADYLPADAGNLDIMTSAATVTAERIATHSNEALGATR